MTENPQWSHLNAVVLQRIPKYCTGSFNNPLKSGQIIPLEPNDPAKNLLIGMEKQPTQQDPKNPAKDPNELLNTQWKVAKESHWNPMILQRIQQDPENPAKDENSVKSDQRIPQNRSGSFRSPNVTEKREESNRIPKIPQRILMNSWKPSEKWVEGSLKCPNHLNGPRIFEKSSLTPEKNPVTNAQGSWRILQRR